MGFSQRTSAQHQASKSWKVIKKKGEFSEK